MYLVSPSCPLLLGAGEGEKNEMKMKMKTKQTRWMVSGRPVCLQHALAAKQSRAEHWAGAKQWRSCGAAGL